MFRNIKFDPKVEEVRQNIGEDMWRKESVEYIRNIEKFLDIVDNIENEDLKKRIIYQHFNCERIIKNIFEGLNDDNSK